MAFCPACGGTKQGAAAPGPVAGLDMTVRRVRMAGIALVSLGAVMTVGLVAVFIFAAEILPETLEQLAPQPGGGFHLHFTENGTGAANATVTVEGVEGPVLNGTTGPGGWWNVTEAPAGIWVNTTWQGETWSRRVFSVAGSPAALEVDTSEARVEDDWVGAQDFLRSVRVMAGVLLLVSLVVIAGGVSALRLHHRGLAMAGGIVGLLPPILLFTATRSLVTMLILGVMAASLAFIVKGRERFKQ